MVDGEIRVSTGATLAAALWGVALGLLVLTWTSGDTRLAVSTVVAGQVAGMATVRQLLVICVRKMKNGFQLGVDSVTPLKR